MYYFMKEETEVGKMMECKEKTQFGQNYYSIFTFSQHIGLSLKVVTFHENYNIKQIFKRNISNDDLEPQFQLIFSSKIDQIYEFLLDSKNYKVSQDGEIILFIYHKVGDEMRLNQIKIKLYEKKLSAEELREEQFKLKFAHLEDKQKQMSAAMEKRNEQLNQKIQIFEKKQKKIKKQERRSKINTFVLIVFMAMLLVGIFEDFDSYEEEYSEDAPYEIFPEQPLSEQFKKNISDQFSSNGKQEDTSQARVNFNKKSMTKLNDRINKMEVDWEQKYNNIFKSINAFSEFDLQSGYLDFFKFFGNQVRYEGADGRWTQLLLKKQIPYDVMTEYKIKVVRSKNNGITFGIVNKNRINMRSSFQNVHTIALMGRKGNVRLNGEVVESLGNGFREGETVTMQVRPWEGKIRWIVDGDLIAEAESEHLKSPFIEYAPYIEMAHNQDVVEWVVKI